MLQRGDDAITEMSPARRRDGSGAGATAAEAADEAAPRGGFVDGIDLFDASFFGIGPRNARAMDPQHRLVLEVTWAALEDAGIPPARLAARTCGVYIGVSTWDYSKLGEGLLPSDIAGNAHSAIPNRVSYTLDLHGPSMAVDTACSSALVALHLAGHALRAGDCDAALVGGVQAMVSPQLFAAAALAGATAPDGRCKVFDADADGYVRGEGCGIVLVKRYADAVADGDRILALVRGSAVNSDGRTSAVTAPSPVAQRTAARLALERAGVEPGEVGFIEVHGTGTPVGDPIEIRALGSIFRRRTSADRPCYLGGVKANVGHLEAAAGMPSLIKTVLALRHGEIPPQPHFVAPHPELRLDETAFAIPAEPQIWNRVDGRRRIASINGFGVGGTNAHVVLEEPPDRRAAARPAPRSWQVLPLSARSAGALAELTAAYAGAAASCRTPVDLENLCVAAGVSRSHHPLRRAFAADSGEDMARQLTAALDAEALDATQASPAAGPPRVAFLFPGQGTAYPGMGARLYEVQPAFRAALDECADILAQEAGWDLPALLWPADESTWALRGSPELQPVVFAFQYALASMWRALGVEPAGLLGHSLGEYVAACVAGALDLRSALRLTCERGRFQRDVCERAPGKMLAVLADADVVAGLVTRRSGRVSVAALNAPEAVAVAGDAEAIDALAAEAEELGVMTRAVEAPPMHSPLLTDEDLAAFEAIASSVSHAAPRRQLVSAMTGTPLRNGAAPDAAYWARHMRAPVDFVAGLRSLRAMGCNVFLETGPGVTLTRLAAKNEHDAGDLFLPSLNPRLDEDEVLARTLAALYGRGLDLDWQAVHAGRPGHAADLPRYPFQRRRYWTGERG
jgi:acyl transferase domain-containing protein